MLLLYIYLDTYALLTDCTAMFIVLYYTFLYYILPNCGPGCSVGIAADYGLDDPGPSPGEDSVFHPSRLSLGPTQPPVKWVPDLSRR